MSCCRASARSVRPCSGWSSTGWTATLRERIEADRPTIAICVGHQLLFETSDENPGVRGLGLVNGHIGRFPDDVRVPQFGWNEVRPHEGALLLEGGYAYFANSYRAIEAPGWAVAHATHGGPFVAAMERGNIIGCQFHPELSGAYGEALLARFLELRLMLTSRIIPCLDVSHGRVVKGVRFQGLRDAGDPAERARLYQDTGRRRDRHPRRLRHARGPRAPARDHPPGARGAVDPAHRRRRGARGRGRLAPAGGRCRQGVGQHRGSRAAGDPQRHRRAFRAAMLRGGDRRRLARRPGRGAGQGRARGHRASTRSNGRARPSGAVPARCC